ncbi:MAG: hypothetical protein QOH61_160 [Chloroflexota bacterium]|jgi:hypothetical protein|nr:hypothetical protein [Chloroflexota bacterium]
MEPNNRPYVEADTEPGDEGTEEWADSPTGDDADRGPLASGGAATDGQGAIKGSPADILDDGGGAGAMDDDAG